MIQDLTNEYTRLVDKRFDDKEKDIMTI